MTETPPDNAGSPEAPADGKGRLVIEMQGVDKRVLARVWEKMRRGEELVGPETYMGQSMADHPEWFPFFETMDVLGGDDTLPDGTNPFEHLTFHIIVGSQIYHRNPPEAETFYRMRLLKGDDRHDVIHMMINVFQRHLAWAARYAASSGQGGGSVQFDMESYAETLRTLGPLKTKHVWQRLGYKVVPAAKAGGKRKKRRR